MSEALGLLQSDLDATGLGHLRISYAVAGELHDQPVVNVQWRGTWTLDAIDLDNDDVAAVTVDVAGQLAHGLIELEGIYWPTCAQHSVRARARSTVTDAAVCLCERSGAHSHVVGAIGSFGPGDHEAGGLAHRTN